MGSPRTQARGPRSSTEKTMRRRLRPPAAAASSASTRPSTSRSCTTAAHQPERELEDPSTQQQDKQRRSRARRRRRRVSRRNANTQQQTCARAVLGAEHRNSKSRGTMGKHAQAGKQTPTGRDRARLSRTRTSSRSRGLRPRSGPEILVWSAPLARSGAGLRPRAGAGRGSRATVMGE